MQAKTGDTAGMNIYEAMGYINSFSKLGKAVTDLSRFARILDALENPQKSLRFIHVAGTNGKGSTVRMLSGIFSASGYVTGEFTSPYIITYNDRIRINGVNISDEELCKIVTAIKPVISGLDEDCSQFEITTAIAFIYFNIKKCDIVILEAGLGGLLDCTNVIERPEASVITSISFDHTAILGDTIEKIAAQKAGIIKDGCPVVLAVNQQKAAEDVVRKTAFIKDCRFITPEKDKLEVVLSDIDGNSFYYKGTPYRTTMPGAHQIDNALTAIETAMLMKSIGWKITNSAIQKGIQTAVVNSRCQVLRKKKPLVIIDGAHNPDGMKKLAEFVSTIPKSPKIMVCGMMADKDWKTALGYITPYIDVGICVDGFAPKTVFAPKLAECFKESKEMSLRKALYRALKLAGNEGMVVIGGSLYLASALRSMSDIFTENQ